MPAFWAFMNVFCASVASLVVADWTCDDARVTPSVLALATTSFS